MLPFGRSDMRRCPRDGYAGHRPSTALSFEGLCSPLDACEMTPPTSTASAHARMPRCSPFLGKRTVEPVHLEIRKAVDDVEGPRPRLRVALVVEAKHDRDQVTPDGCSR